MPIYTVGLDLKLTPVAIPRPSKEKLKIGESVAFFDRRRMSKDIAEVLPTREDNLNSYNRLVIGDLYKVVSYFPNIVDEETFTGKLAEKEFVDNEYPLFKFNINNKETRLVSTFDMCVSLTRVEDTKQI